MDFERIQQLASTARVMRTNSEQQRRRRDQNAQDFSELLEENMEEDSQESEQAQQQAPPAGQDTVTLSSTGKVSAETMRAASTLARISMAQRQMIELFNPSFNTVADGTDTEPEPEHSDKVDEVV